MKRLWLVLIGALILGGIGAGTYLFLLPTSTHVTNTEGATLTPTPAPVTLATWKDPAGFSVQYPEGLTLNKHDEDKDNYAHLEFTDTGRPGRIIIWEKDLPKGVTDLASWVKKDSMLSEGILFDTTLGGKPAKKVLVATPKKQIYVGTLDDDVLLYIEGAFADDAMWQTTYDTITKTLTFTSEGGSAGQAEDSGGSEAVDEEETIE